MGSLSMVFSAKVMAILRCTELLLTKNLMRRIHICSDSRAALAALAKTTTESSLVWECMQVLEKQSKVTLMWIPRHQEIPGNEEADRLAKEGALEVPPNQFAAIPFSVGKNLKKQLEQKHWARWSACSGC
jgi:ribonuclease HI